MSRGIMETGSALARRNARGVTAVFRLYFVDSFYSHSGGTRHVDGKAERRGHGSPRSSS